MPLGDVRTNPQTGEFFQLTGQGWVPVTQDVAERAVQNPIIATAKGFGLGVQSLGTGLLALGGNERAAAAFGESQQQLAELNQSFPLASRIGEFAPDILGVGGLARGALRAGTRRGVSENVQRRISEAGSASSTQARNSAAQATDDAVASSLGDRVRQSGVDSAGAASILDFLPRGLRERTDRIFNDVFTSGELSPFQTKALANADEIGWQFLPGQRSGNTFASEVAMRNPLLRDAFAEALNDNRLIYNRSLMRALGNQSDEVVDLNMVAETSIRLGREFDDIAAEMNPISFSPRTRLRRELTEIANELPAELDLSATNAASRDLNNLLNRADLAAIDGEQFQRFHSRWRQRATRARRATDVEGNEVADIYSRAVDAMNDAFIRSRNTPQLLDRYSQVRERWRILKVLEKPGVFDRQTQNFNPVNLNGRLLNEFGNQFRSDVAQNLRPETQQLFNTVKVARAFKDTLGDSGTASGQAFTDAIQNPRKALGLLAVRELIRREVNRINPPRP